MSATPVINCLLRNIVARLILYYGAVSLAFAGAVSAFPEIIVYMKAERLRGGDVSFDFNAVSVVGAAHQGESLNPLLDPYTSVPVIFSLLSVMSLTIPVAWVYRWTRNPARYSPSIAQALLVLPLAIALVVFLVKSSLALAFSLAGIVAAVRFRTALSESEDAVYMFVVIGIGLAAGVQLANVAFIASVFFNAVALQVWSVRFGSRPARLNGWWLAPEEDEAVPESSKQVITHLAQADRYNARLSLPTIDIERSEKAAIPVLDAAARAWRISGVSRGRDGRSVVEIEARLKGSVNDVNLARDLEDSAQETGRVSLARRKKSKVPEKPVPPPEAVISSFSSSKSPSGGGTVTKREKTKRRGTKIDDAKNRKKKDAGTTRSETATGTSSFGDYDPSEGPL